MFVFGLSGSNQQEHTLHSVVAAMELLDLVTADGSSWNIGISTGHCFCGPLGDTKRRCEYVVMGGKAIAVLGGGPDRLRRRSCRG